MTPAKGDAALVAKLFADNGYGRLNVAAGASSLVVSSPEESGAMRERFRLVAMPKLRYRVEVSEGGRWRDARITGLLAPVVAQVLKSGAAGAPLVAASAPASSERLDRLRAHRKPR